MLKRAALLHSVLQFVTPALRRCWLRFWPFALHGGGIPVFNFASKAAMYCFVSLDVTSHRRSLHLAGYHRAEELTRDLADCSLPPPDLRATPVYLPSFSAVLGATAAGAPVGEWLLHSTGGSTCRRIQRRWCCGRTLICFLALLAARDGSRAAARWAERSAASGCSLRALPARLPASAGRGGVAKQWRQCGTVANINRTLGTGWPCPEVGRLDLPPEVAEFSR